MRLLSEFAEEQSPQRAILSVRFESAWASLQGKTTTAATWHGSQRRNECSCAFLGLHRRMAGCRNDRIAPTSARSPCGWHRATRHREGASPRLTRKGRHEMVGVTGFQPATPTSRMWAFAGSNLGKCFPGSRAQNSFRCSRTAAWECR